MILLTRKIVDVTIGPGHQYTQNVIIPNFLICPVKLISGFAASFPNGLFNQNLYSITDTSGNIQ